MKRIILSALFVCIALTYGLGQIDSVELKLNAYIREDTTKVEMLIDACVSTTFKSEDKSIIWATQATNMAHQLHYVVGEIRATNCVGNYYYQHALYDRGLEYYYKALKMAESRNDTKNIIIGKSNVANILTHTKRLSEAIHLFKECNQLLSTGNDSLGQNRAAILTNLATAYSANNQHDSSVLYYNHVYQICEKKNIGFGLAITLTNLANEYYSLKKYEQSLKCCQEAVILIKKYNMGFLEGFNLTVLGKVWLALGDYKKGVAYLQEAISVNKKNGDLGNLPDSYAKLHIAYASKKEYAKAYDALLNYVEANDSLFSLEKNKTIEEMNTKYNTEKKENQITSLQNEKTISELTSQRKSLLLYFVIGFIVMAGVVSYVLFARFRYKKENQVLITQIAHEQNLNKSVLKSIKAQMNPHFFYNALNTIQASIFNDDKKNASIYLNKFSNLTRMILEMSEKERVPLSQEIKALTLYLELEQARFTDNFVFTLSTSSALDIDLITIPAMLIQPYVENAIKHGLLHKKEQRQLVIDITQESNILIIKVDDNGIGRKESAAINQQRSDKPASFASQANEVRLAILNEGRTNKVGIEYIDKHYDSQPSGTTVTISIPLYS